MNAVRHVTSDANWRKPVAWNEKATKSGEPWRVFCSSMADVFEDRRDLDEQRVRLWKLIDETPALTWMLLTKRPEQIRHMAPERWLNGKPGVWVGTTVENQPEAEKRVLYLIEAEWADVRFVSCEPLLAGVDLTRITVVEGDGGNKPGVYLNALAGHVAGPDDILPKHLDWVIAGGESGPGARPMDPALALSLRDQCTAAGVAFHFKQWGEYGADGVRRAKKINGYVLDGAVLKAFP